LKPFDYLPLIRKDLASMIRDTFATNPGLCELFKRKILERARFVGLSEGLIDFEAHIDMKGTYQDNLRTFYRQYPQLSQDSDYFRIKSIRPLSGAALEQSWRGYERNNGHEILELTREPTEQPLTAGVMHEFFITYNIGGESLTARKEAPKEPETISIKPTLQQVEANPAASTYRELAKSDWLTWASTIPEFKPKPIENLERREQDCLIPQDGEPILSFQATMFQSILDRVTAMVGEKVAKIILHQIGQEIGKTAFNDSKEKILSGNLAEALDHVLNIRGWGRVLDLDKTEHVSSVTYVCTIKGCPLCYKRISTRPTCDIMRGIVSGWLKSFVQKNAESIETACVATGSTSCVFRVTFKK
jgi:predicted hydrocarbon binding protein